MLRAPQSHKQNGFTDDGATIVSTRHDTYWASRFFTL